MKLLIVDNQADAREAVRKLMTSPSVAIRECASGEEAVRAAREFKPDWVTMDLHIDGLNAFEAAALIRQDNPSVRIVMLSYEDELLLSEKADNARTVTRLVKGNFTALRDLLMGGGSKDDSATGSGETGVESPND